MNTHYEFKKEIQPRPSLPIKRKPIFKEKSFDTQLCKSDATLSCLQFAEEFNGLLTYSQPATGEHFAFYKSEEHGSVVYLPGLSRILYGSSLPDV